MFSKFGKKLKEIVSGGEKQPEQAVLHQWMDREPRVSGTGIIGICCYFDISNRLIRFNISNISTTGIALDRDAMPEFAPAMNSAIIGVVEIDGKRHSVPMSLKRVDSKVLAFQYQKRDFDFDTDLKKKFNVEIAAMKMLKMRPELLEGSVDGVPHAFNGKSDCRLFYMEKGGQVIQFEVGFFGNVIEGFHGDAVRFSIVMHDTPADVQFVKSHSMNPYAGDLSQLKEEALRFVQNVGGLDPSAKNTIFRAIQDEKLA